MKNGVINAYHAPQHTTRREEWMDDALCGQTDLAAFFPEDGNLTSRAQAVCAKCDVAAQCLQYAVDHHIDHGTWGGVSAAQRNRTRRGAA